MIVAGGLPHLCEAVMRVLFSGVEQMNIKRHTFIVVLVLLAGVAVAGAQEWRERIEVALGQKNTYNFREMALGDLIREIAADAQINIILDSEIGGVDRSRKLTIRMTDMSYESIITWVSRAVGLEWVVQDEAVFIAPRNRMDEAARRQLDRRAATMRARAERTWLPHFREVLARPHKFDLRSRQVVQTAESLEALLGVNFVVSPEVSDRITVSLAVSDMSAESIIAWVARKAGIDYAVLNEAIYFAPDAEIRDLRVAGLDFSSRGRPWDEVSFAFEDTPFMDAIADLSSMSGVHIVVNSDIAELPSVTLAGHEMSLIDALRAITRQTRLNTLISTDQGTVFVSVRGTGVRAPAPPPPDAPQGDEAAELPPTDSPETVWPGEGGSPAA